MKVIRALTSLGLAVAALCAVSLGAESVSVLDTDDAQVVQAGQSPPFTRQCFQNVSDCIVCTSNNTSCTLSGRIDTCRLTPNPTQCLILVNPPTCGRVVKWSMPNCSGISAISLTQFCFEFICV